MCFGEAFSHCYFECALAIDGGDDSKHLWGDSCFLEYSKYGFVRRAIEGLFDVQEGNM